MEIIPPKNFNLDQIYESGQCFRWINVENGKYAIPIADNHWVLKQSGNKLECLPNSKLKQYFDLDTDYLEIETEVYHTHDKHLIKCYEFGKGIHILRQPLWETTVSFIISQNNNIPRIKQCIEAICGGAHFPSPRKLYEMDLSDKGLGYREPYIKDACKHFMNPRFVDLLHNDDHQIARDALLDIKGVGNKVADCIRLFGLHHLEAFPVDTHIQQVIDREYGGMMPEWVNNRFAGVFQQYLFYWDLKHKEVIS